MEMAQNFWETLPSIIIVEILSYLSLTDRLNASSVCKRWRSCLFHPTLWRSLHFKFKYDSRKKAYFLLEKCGRFVRNSVIEFNSKYFAHVNDCLRALEPLRDNVNVERLAIKPSSFEVSWPDQETEGRSRTTENTVDLFVCAISDIIRNSRHLRHLSLGCIPELTDNAEDFLFQLSQFQSKSIESLHIASVKEDPDSYALLNIPLQPFTIFKNLHTLSIDYDNVNNRLLQIFTRVSPNRTTLRKLIIHIHGIDDEHEKIANVTWEQLLKANPGLAVTLNLIHSVDGSAKLLDILQPAMPLVNFRMFFCQAVSMAAVHFIAKHMWQRLESIFIVDGMDSNDMPFPYDITEEEEDPFVMMAWKCVHLKHFTIIGYDMCAEDIIAIARLRGPQLQTLDIPLCCITQEDEVQRPYLLANGNPEEFIGEVSQSLRREWHPMPDADLAEAVRDPRANAETAYLATLLSDQQWQ